MHSEIYPFKFKDGKWGYKDNNNNITTSKYNGAMPYHDGICWVKHMNWGGIDINGKVIIPFIYKSVYRLAPNVYRVLGLNNKFGVIDNNGNIIIDINMTGYLMISIVLIVLSLIFQLITLPVEFDASKRAIAILDEWGLLNQTEINGVKKVLGAAALTYVAAALTSLISRTSNIIARMPRQ